MWEELKYDIKYMKDSGPMVVLGETALQKWMTKFSSVFFPAKIKYFDKRKELEAREWIESKIS